MNAAGNFFAAGNILGVHNQKFPAIEHQLTFTTTVVVPQDKTSLPALALTLRCRP